MALDIEKIKNYWDSKIGLLSILLIFLSTYYSIIKSIIIETVPMAVSVSNILIPAIVCIIVYLVWAVQSHRICLIKRKKITIGIFLKTDDAISSVIKHVTQSSIDEIKESFGEITVKLFPLNFINNRVELGRYLASNSHSLDCAIFANIINGNSLNDSTVEQKVIINNIVFSGHFDTKENLRIFRTTINLSKDLSLRNLNKNWEYIENNSLNDKQKIKANLKDTILFYAGLYLIYMKELDEALEIFKKLKAVEDSQVTNQYNFIKKGRLNNILLELFFLSASNYYFDKKNPEKSYFLLKECESYFKEQHPLYFSHLISLARLAYENNNINEAFYYAAKAEKINKHSTLVYLNNAFFALMKNDVENTYKYYKQLAHTYKHKDANNYVDTIEFLERESIKYTGSKYLFDFAIGMLNFFYVDKDFGEKQLNELRSKINDDINLVKIYELTTHFLDKGAFKPVYARRQLMSKKKKRK